jgi:hypothetical protein
MMRALENILDIGLYLLVLIIFAPLYLLINVIDWVKGKDGNDD